eukprot:48201-Ditylum_brightwellii.AAC.1
MMSNVDLSFLLCQLMNTIATMFAVVMTFTSHRYDLHPTTTWSYKTLICFSGQKNAMRFARNGYVDMGRKAKDSTPQECHHHQRKNLLGLQQPVFTIFGGRDNFIREYSEEEEMAAASGIP